MSDARRGGLARRLSVTFALAAALVAFGGLAVESAQAKGGLIVFERFDPETETVRLYTMRPDGSRLHAITNPTGNADEDSQAKLSPNGRRVVFRRFFNRGTEDERTDLMVVKTDGTHLRNLTRDNCTGDCLGSDEPAWAPNGKRIVFMRALAPFDEEGFPSVVGLFTMSADGSNVRQATQLTPGSGLEDHVPSWSPNGKRIAFLRINVSVEPVLASSIYTVRPDGSKARLVHEMPLEWPASGVPRWSPSGRRILFDTYCLFGDCGQPPTGAQLFTIKRDGARLRQVTDLPGNAFDGSWAPNGRRIVFARNAEVSPTADLFVIRHDGKKLRRLTNQPELDSHNPDWGRTKKRPGAQR